MLKIILANHALFNLNQPIMNLAQFNTQAILSAYWFLKRRLDKKEYQRFRFVHSVWQVRGHHTDDADIDDKNHSTVMSGYFIYELNCKVSYITADAFTILSEVIDGIESDDPRSSVLNYNFPDFQFCSIDSEAGEIGLIFRIKAERDSIPQDTYPKSVVGVTMRTKAESSVRALIKYLVIYFENRLLPSVNEFTPADM